jgi:hypothetical protein
VDAWAQAAQHLVLGDRSEADQHDDAVAEQHRGPAFADAEGERVLEMRSRVRDQRCRAVRPANGRGPRGEGRSPGRQPSSVESHS